MGKITTTTINQFNGGIAKDKRLKDFRFFGLTKNFDVSTYSHKLEPLRSLTPAETKNLEIVKFLVNPSYPGGAKLAGLGVPVGGAVAEVYHWSGTQWLASLGNNVSSIGARDKDVFFYYKGFIYMWGGTALKRMDATGTIGFNDTYQSISYTTVVQPLIHPTDDIAYFFSDNKIHTLDNVTFSADVLTLPSTLRIKSACVYGNYIAIACSSANNINDTSVVYLWDRDTSLETLSESIDFGNGRIEYLATLDNQLVAVSYNHPKILIKKLNGTTSVIINELITDQSDFSNIPNVTSQVIDNKLYFPASVQLDGNTRNGIWELRSNGSLSLVLSDSSIGQIEGLYKTEANWWIAHSGDGSVDRTVNKNVNTFAEAIYESIVIGSAEKNHKLISVGVITEPLPANGEVVLEYKKDTGLNLDVWTEIYDRGVDNTQYSEALRHDSDGSVLPTFRELQFRVTCKGGAVFMGLKFNIEELDTNLIQ